MKLFNEKLEGVGLKSLQAASKPIVAALVSEKPILFISDNPVAIASLSSKIFRGLYEIESEENQGLGVYDARKTQKRDLFGVPAENDSGVDTDAESEQMETITNKSLIFINELAKSKKSMKPIWTNVLRSEKVEGQSFENLKYIIGCIGESKKKNRLDPDQADAFGLMVPAPSTGSIDTVGNISMASILYWGKSPRSKLNLKKLIVDIKKIRQNLPPEHITLIREYVTAFAKELEQNEIELPESRQTALAENLELFFAIDLYEGELISAQIEQNLLLASQYNWVYFATSKNPKLKVLKKAYYSAIKGLIEPTEFSKSHFKVLKQIYPGKANPEANSAEDSDIGGFDEDIDGLIAIVESGVELFTTGFYEMVIKGNSDWKSKLDINN